MAQKALEVGIRRDVFVINAAYRAGLAQGVFRVGQLKTSVVPERASPTDSRTRVAAQ